MWYAANIYRPGFTASLKALDAVKDGELDAFISICSPVCGLRPFLAFLWESLNVPNPVRLIFLPAATS